MADIETTGTRLCVATGDRPVARRLRITAFDKLAETMVIR